MTDLQRLYTKARLELKLGHRSALAHVAAETGLDEGSVSRALARARREDERAAKGAR
jgi:hypothetical protein